MVVYGESIYEKWQGRRTKIRRGIIKSHQASIPGGGVTGWRWRTRLRKVLVTRERRSNDEWDVKGEVRSTNRLREVLIYRDAGTLRLRLELTANLRVNSLGDKLAELRRKYSWHYAYA